MMKPKTIISAVLLIFVAVSAGFLVFKESTKSKKQTPAKNAPAAIPKDNAARDDVLIVYFFHGRARCKSCKIIEAFGKKTLESRFADELKSGRIVWRDIDLDEPENRHFVQDYQILSISLVISDMHGKEQKQWKNLEQVWDLLNNENAFIDYVQKEIEAWL
jgi:hypothetical protein